MKFTFGLILTCITLTVMAGAASAHGYIESPRSRSYECKLRSTCGEIQYEPQSVEGPDRYPDSGPTDGKIASAGIARFSALDAQSNNMWPRQKMDSGQNTFTWNLTAAHRSKDWRYFITKPNWDPNAPITRGSFESEPFCVNTNSSPSLKESHSCNVPERSGYHLILAVWDVGDTSNSFYQVIDAEFSGNNQGPTTTQRPTTTQQPTTSQRPTTTRGSGGSQETTTTARDTIPAKGMSVSGVDQAYSRGSNVAVNFNVSSPDTIRVRYFIKNKRTNSRVASGTFRLSADSKDVTATIKQPKAGRYKLVVVGKTSDGKRFVKRSHFKIKDSATAKPATIPPKGSNYDHTFPENLRSYSAGTKVLQPKDGKVYRCRPFPYSGFCGQWSQHATQLEPGVGIYSQLAWIPVTP